jgi:hypothetical protein
MKLSTIKTVLETATTLANKGHENVFFVNNDGTYEVHAVDVDLHHVFGEDMVSCHCRVYNIPTLGYENLDELYEASYSSGLIAIGNWVNFEPINEVRGCEVLKIY